MGYTHYWTPDTAESLGLVVDDARAIIAAANVPLAGWDGTGDAEITDTRISLNGAAPDDCETFLLVPNGEWDFCKTGHRPYDEVVTAILVSAWIRGALKKLSSDGYVEDWADGIALYEKAVCPLGPFERAQLAGKLGSIHPAVRS